MIRRKICAILIVLLIVRTLDAESAQAADGVESSVVKLLVTKRQPDFLKPWTKAAPEKVSGSGVVIDGKRILTNAHVVMHASEVFVQMRRGGDQLAAKVKAIGPGIDLAIVELADPDKLKDIAPLELAKELPQLKSRVSVYGYPKGGDDLSVTDGIVSRIEFTTFNFSAGGVRVQVDAALNPGNSGGPAVDDGKIVGLVFSKIVEAENIGYLIPPDEIRAFLDGKDGKYAGNPLLFDERLAKDEKIDLTLLRDGKKKEVSVPVAPRRDYLAPILEDRYPEYFIYGPLVFTAATQEYVRTIGASSGVGGLLTIQSPLISRLYKRPAEKDEQLVVIATRMFPHRIIKGYENRPFGTIGSLNGKKVKNLKSLAELLRDSNDEFLRFEMSDRSEALVFKRSELEAATEEILSSEGIRYQASSDLRDIVEKE